MIITKGNQRREVSPKAGKIACQLMGWVEEVPAKKPVEIGKKTVPPPPIVLENQPIKLKEVPVQEFPKPAEATEAPKVDTGNKVEEKAKSVEVKKTTRKKPVRSKAKK